MVTKKELTGFKQTLTTALQKAGYTEYGRITSSDYNHYAHLPEDEMISQYVEVNNLDEINRVYRIVNYINDNSDNFYSLKTLCRDNGIDYKLFTHVVDNMPYINQTGNRRTTQYHWNSEEQPSFNTAKEIVDYMRKLKTTKLNKGLKEKIAKAVAKGISKDDFFKSNKIKKDATYSAESYYTYAYQKLRQQKSDDGDDITESSPDNMTKLESSSIIPEGELQDIKNYDIAEEEESISQAEEVQSLSDVHDDAGLQMENYILRQEIKYLKKINKAKNKLIKALRKMV